MEYIVAFFKKFIEFILNILVKKTNSKEMNFIVSGGDILLTSEQKTFLVKEVN